MIGYVLLTLCFAGLGLSVLVVMAAFAQPLRPGCDCPACERQNRG